MRYEVLNGSRAGGLLDAMRDLYADVYAEPPYCEGEEHVNQFVEHFADEVNRPGFTLVEATEDQSLIGAVYGWTMAPGKWFGSPTGEPPAEVRDLPKFAIIEWMVRRNHRGTGVGRHLIDLILASRSEPFAILASNPAALARQIYEQWGWQHCGGTNPPLMPPMDVLVLPLNRTE